jgi:2-dehydro-3-deoxygluconokinase
MAQYDVITLGETMIRLTPPGLKRLEQARSFEVDIGGTESNMAIGLARLGLKVLWLSRLTANPLGRLIANTIAGYGVDTSRVVWTEADRVGMLFFEEGRAPRGSRVFYDRQGSAVSRMRPAELPGDLFRPEGARLLHLTGITVALGVDIAATAQHALHAAKAAGWLVSFDVNYRRQLWTPQAARQGCAPYVRAADILFIPRGDACALFDLPPATPPEQILARLAQDSPQTTIVVTLGKDGAIGYEPPGRTVRQAAFPAEEVGRLGGGDAFAAGFLYAFLRAAEPRERLATALRWGTACAALKYTVPGDIPLIERRELEALVEQGSGGPVLLR